MFLPSLVSKFGCIKFLQSNLLLFILLLIILLLLIKRPFGRIDSAFSPNRLSLLALSKLSTTCSAESVCRLP